MRLTKRKGSRRKPVSPRVSKTHLKENPSRPRDEKYQLLRSRPKGLPPFTAVRPTDPGRKVSRFQPKGLLIPVVKSTDPGWKVSRFQPKGLVIPAVKSTDSGCKVSRFPPKGLLISLRQRNILTR